MFKWYVSGPIAAPDADGEPPTPGLILRRKAEMNHLCAKLRKQFPSYTIINPLEVTACTREEPFCDAGYAGQADGHDWECYLRYDVRALLLVDSIVMMPGWERSPGALLEKEVSQFFTIGAYFWVDGNIKIRPKFMRGRPDFIDEAGWVRR